MKKINQKIPVITNATVFSAVFARLNDKEFYCNMENMFYSQLKTRALFGCCGAPSFCHINWVGESLGSKNIYSDGRKITIPKMQPLLQDMKEIMNFEFPVTIESDILKMRKNFFSIARQNGFNKITMMAGSVIEMLAQIMEPEMLLRGMIRQPEIFHKLCQQMSEYLLMIIDDDINTFGADNCVALFCYPMESRDIMTPRLLEEFSWPYIKYMHEQLLRRGVKLFQEHLCGNQNSNLSFFKELHLPEKTCFSLDEKTDLLKTAQFLGDKYTYAGNVSSSVLANGSYDEVLKECKLILDIGKKLKGNFILAPSCDLPPYTPPLNLSAMCESVKLYGECGE